MKRKIIAGVLVIILGALVLLTKSEKKEYEYYTLEGKRGISKYCTSKAKVECRINNKMIEVAQFSRER